MKLDPRSFKGLSRFLAPSAGGPLADRALEERLISAEQLQECIREQDRSGRPLDELLVERGFLKTEEVTRLKQPPLPAEVLEAAADPLRHLGHYVLVDRVGTGGMAEVWKAWDRSLGRWVAVKYLKPDIGHPTQRIEREGRMAGRLSHPGIISIFERGQYGGRPYLVMPFVQAKPLPVPMPPLEAARLVLEVADALAHAHAMGVIHRDVKPGNILLEEGGRVLLADFGLAIPDDSGASRWAISGTPEYASPEQVRGDQLDARTDIYSLGATLYHLLSGRPPFVGKGPAEIAEQVLNGEPPPLERAPRPLAKVVERSMTRDRDRRYATMGEFADELRRHVLRSSGRRRLRLVLLAVIVIAAVLPWGVTAAILRESRVREERETIGNLLRTGERSLAAAERVRSDPEASARDVEAAVRRAIPSFNLAIRLAGGQEPEASQYLGRCHELLGEDDRAEYAWLDAERFPAARLGLARIWIRRWLEGRRDRDFRALVRNRVPHNHLYHAVADGRWEEAMARGIEALEADRHDDMAHVGLALAAGELGRADEAARRWEQAVRLRREDPTLRYHLGLALAARGDRAGAAGALARALELAGPRWGLASAARAKLAELRTP